MEENGQNTSDIKLILERLNLLEKRVSSLEKFIREKLKVSLDSQLALRGLVITESGDPVLVSPDIDKKLYEKLKSYYFRRIVVDILMLGRFRREEAPLYLKRWGEEVETHLKFLEEVGIVAESNGDIVSRFSFNYSGLILEWFLSRFLAEEFGIESKYAVRLKNLKYGGDIDVLGVYDYRILMIECKESPPNNVPVSELRLILRRIDSLKPDIFLFVIDTTLSIKRNIVDNMNWILKSEIKELKNGVYAFGKNRFLISAKRDLLKNISFAIRSID